MTVETLIAGSGKHARSIAIRQRTGASPGFFWLGGYRSDMAGTKARALDEWCGRQGFACCRHDYSGHGESGGQFRDGTISRWLEESLAVFNACATGPQIVVASSMGAWIALLMARELAKRGQYKTPPARLQAMLLIAPAPDFTHELLLPQLDAAQKRALAETGVLEMPSRYSSDPDIFTAKLIADGEKNRVMTGLIETGCPVHILQGLRDPDVPHTHALKLAEFLPAEQAAMTLVNDGDHRLSRPQDIALMLRIAEDLARHPADWK